jgi:CRP/FNR family transcriptional regulator
MTLVTPTSVYTDLPKPKPAAATGAARCTASDLLRWAGLADQVSDQTDKMPYATRRVRADTALVHEGNPFEYLYFVCAGSFKCVQVDAEGYEQVLGFALHADMIGLDGMSRGRHASGAVALEDSTVASLPFTEIMSASRRMPAIERLIQRAVGAELLRRSDTQYLMSAPRTFRASRLAAKATDSCRSNTRPTS